MLRGDLPRAVLELPRRVRKNRTEATIIYEHPQIFSRVRAGFECCSHAIHTNLP